MLSDDLVAALRDYTNEADPAQEVLVRNFAGFLANLPGGFLPATPGHLAGLVVTGVEKLCREAQYVPRGSDYAMHPAARKTIENLLPAVKQAAGDWIEEDVFALIDGSRPVDQAIYEFMVLVYHNGLREALRGLKVAGGTIRPTMLEVTVDSPYKILFERWLSRKRQFATLFCAAPPEPFGFTRGEGNVSDETFADMLRQVARDWLGSDPVVYSNTFHPPR